MESWSRAFATWLALLLALVLPVAHGSAAESAREPATDGTRALRVLFVGNSYTYYNNLPAVFSAIGRFARAIRDSHHRFRDRRHLGAKQPRVGDLPARMMAVLDRCPNDGCPGSPLDRLGPWIAVLDRVWIAWIAAPAARPAREVPARASAAGF